MASASTTPELSEEPWATAERAFCHQCGRLLRRYAGQCVALYQGRVVGHGVDDEVLAQELFERLGDVPFYIAKVEAEPTVYDLPSPETVR